MITTEEESTKGSIGGKKRNSYFFPVEKVTIVADTYEEALEIINNRKEK